MKKIWKAVIAAVAVAGSAFAFAACAGGEHTEHDFTGAWVTTDPEYHWHICTADGCEETDEKVAHDWVADDSKTDVPATCIADGIRYLKCACGATKSEPITTRPAHDFTGAWVTTDPDNHWHICTTEGCDETDTKGAHDWVDSDKPDKPATCIADGEHYLKCSGCGAEKIEPITTRPNHSYTGAEWVTTDPDKHWHVCTTEGCTEIDEKVSHDWVDSEKPDKPATCIADGEHYLKCSGCGAEKIEPITTRPDHSFTGAEWVTTDPNYHWHVCTTDGCNETDEKVAHSWEDGDVITEADADNDGLRKVTCSVCHAESTKVIPATGHPKGTTLKYEEGGTTHWYGCAAHTECGKKYDEAPHSFDTHVEAEDKAATCGEDGYTVWECECGAKERRTVNKTGAHDYESQPYVSDGASGHYRECKVCHAHSETVAHSLVDGTTVTEPTFWAAGSKNVTCSDCDYEGTAPIERKDTASFVDDFSLDANPNGSWSYGKTVYNFDNETFEFTKATDKNDGGDGWKIDGCCEIKKGFIDSGNWATVAFTFTEETAATVKFKFTGNNADDGNNTPNTFNCRIGVKNASGVLYSAPAYYGGEGVGLHVCSNLDENGNGVGYNFNAGDTIYFMIEHKEGWASGNLELTITRNAQTNA